VKKTISTFYFFYTFLGFTLLSASPSSAQVVLNAGGIININGGAAAANIVYVVLNAPPATPVKTIGGGSNGMMMETEYSVTQYNLGTATTNITLPYLSSALESFPLTVSSITAGIGAGNIQFSSKKAPTRATGWDNAAYMPSGVTNMQGAAGVPDNSAYSIDRFWIIDPQGYVLKPAVTLGFTYINAEGAANGSNTLTLANLLAQRWNTTLGTWVDYYPQGTNATGGTTGTVTNVVVPALDFFRTWTLNDLTAPLPIDLISYSGACDAGKISLQWKTASETNSNYFTLERSTDGSIFQFVTTVKAAGNSSQTLQYSYADDVTGSGPVYYKLSETDFDGTQKTFQLIDVASCGSLPKESVTVYSGKDGPTLEFYSLTEQTLLAKTYDFAGRLVSCQSLNAGIGSNSYNLNQTIPNGIYLFVLKTQNTTFSKRIPFLK
jgi:hypothetical protein